jgi:hypothetical protein
MTGGQNNHMLWRVAQSGNPNKAWVCLRSGEKLSPLLPLKAARVIVNDHNQTVEFLLNHIDRRLS